MSSPTKVHVAGWRQCSYFQKTANIAASLEHLYPSEFEVEILELKDRAAYVQWIAAKHAEEPATSHHKSSPYVWLNDSEFVGGCDDFMKLCRKEFFSGGGRAKKSNSGPQALPDKEPAGDYDYDLIVIGGGSGGLSCAKAASCAGANVALLDYVKPSPHGSQWGLGGTCVNVGCIPKKLMHHAALLGEYVADSKSFGWNVETDSLSHSWESLVEACQNHIGSLNFGYRVQLREKKVKYINALGTFVDPHTLKCVDKKGKETTITGRRFVIAVGGRPTALPCPGGELAISSDDLFSLPTSPGSTMVIGASYVALECAGFLRTLGLDVTVMVRSILLRGFDQQMANLIGDYMKDHGVKFIRERVPTKLSKLPSGKIKVEWEGGEGEFDTVIAAVGRTADTAGLNLQAAGLKVEKNGKFIAVQEQTNVPHIYAIGDVLQGPLELTPIAIQAGALLANRLYTGSNEQMDYQNVCTTIFTPIEYGCVGLSEEDAREQFPNIDVYHTHFTPLEWFPCAERGDNVCYCKVIVNLDDDEKVLGMHFLGPNAGEVTQGFGVGMKLGMHYEDLHGLVGIHPTCAEEFTTLTVTKSSGEDALKSGC